MGLSRRPKSRRNWSWTETMLSTKSQVPSGEDTQAMAEHTMCLKRIAMLVVKLANSLAVLPAPRPKSPQAGDSKSVKSSQADDSESVKSSKESILQKSGARKKLGKVRLLLTGPDGKETPLASSRDKSHFSPPASHPSTPESGDSNTVDSDSDPENNIDADIAQMNFKNAIKAFSLGNYSHALTEFSAGFKRIRRLAFRESEFRIAIQEHEIRLALCLLWHGKSDESMQRLISLVNRVYASDSFQYTSGRSPYETHSGIERNLKLRDKDRVVVLQAFLGIIHKSLVESNIEYAEITSRKLLKQCTRWFGKRHPIYLSTV